MNATALENARKKFFNKLPQRIGCPKCEKNRKKEMFGVRLMNGPEVKTKKADPVFRVQSYCNVCRHE